MMDTYKNKGTMKIVSSMEFLWVMSLMLLTLFIIVQEESDEDVESESLSSLFDSNTSLSSINYSAPATTQFSPYNSTSYGILSKSDTGIFQGTCKPSYVCTGFG